MALVPYALGQAARVRDGLPAVAGNHVVIRLAGSDAHVALVHLRLGFIRVSVGQRVVEGRPIAACGKLRQLDAAARAPAGHGRLGPVRSPRPADAFRCFREWPSGTRRSRVREHALPGEGAVVQPVPVPPTAAGP
jgi:hypothetical protein